MFNRELTILVKSDEVNSLKILNAWSQSGKVDEAEALRLEQEGKIIRLGSSSDGTSVTTTLKKSSSTSSSSSTPSAAAKKGKTPRPRTSTGHASYASYVNIGDERYAYKSSSLSNIIESIFFM